MWVYNSFGPTIEPLANSRVMLLVQQVYESTITLGGILSLWGCE